MDTSLKKTKNKEKAKDAPEAGATEESSGALAEAREAQPPVVHSDSPEMSGDFDDNDIKLPILNIAQNIGKLSRNFTPGELILNKEVVLAQGDPETYVKIKSELPQFLEVVVMQFTKTFEEIVEFDGDEIARVLPSKEAVYAEGGLLGYDNGKDENGKDIKPTWRERADLLLMIKHPDTEEQDDLNFPYEYEGALYTPATWTLRGTAYNSAGREVRTANKFYYREGLKTGSFKLTCPYKAFPSGNGAFIATLSKYKKHTPEFIKWLEDFGL